MSADLFRNAEIAIFTYFVSVLQSTPGVDAYEPDQLPRILANPKLGQWAVRIGGNDPLEETPRRNTRAVASPCWAFGGELFGIFETRQKAWAVASMAMNGLPAGEADIVGVRRLDWASMPTVEHDVILQGTSGVELRGSRLSLPLSVKFRSSVFGV